ncbi:MAG: hypothetical protein JXR97_06040 [Planctomycetes bacterium]|nr:hypothetical protein [Planctomycetota bacterium]
MAKGFDSLSQKEIAAILGVSDKSIRKFVKEDGMPHVKRGRYFVFNSPEAVAWYVKYRMAEREAEAQIKIDEHMKRLEQDGIEPDSVNDEDDPLLHTAGSTFYSELFRKRQARKVELHIKREMGKLLDREVVCNTWTAAAGKLRGLIEASTRGFCDKCLGTFTASFEKSLADIEIDINSALEKQD